MSVRVCVHCTVHVAHNIAQNRPDNFSSYPPDNHHCSDDEGGEDKQNNHRVKI